MHQVVDWKGPLPCLNLVLNRNSEIHVNLCGIKGADEFCSALFSQEQFIR